MQCKFVHILKFFLQFIILFLFCSNYHSEQLLIPLWTACKKSQIQIAGYMFSTSGDGKDLADTFIGTDYLLYNKI